MKAHATTSRASYRDFDGNEDWRRFQAAVSLHSHTHHSREVMACLPQYFARIPLVGSRFERKRQTALAPTGDSFDFSKGWWHPPVGPRQVFESEVQQIERRFGLSSIVSVTDHDDIAAGIELQGMYALRRAPISFEWRVPYGDGFFHLGIHNLPPDDAGVWSARLASFTAEPGIEPLADMLARPEMLPASHTSSSCPNTGNTS
jgi:hypothetical protein